MTHSPIIRSPYSQAPIRISLQDPAGEIGTASAFIYSVENEKYLITNWHCVSGKNSFTDQLLNGHRSPLYLNAYVATWANNDEPRGFGLFPCRVPLYEDDARTPRWLEHPVRGRLCDVVALPVTLPPDNVPEFMHTPVNKISDKKIPVRPGCPAFIIGYPDNLRVGFGLPVWKSGFIASEPAYDVTVPVGSPGSLRDETIPAFFLDALTRQGMSGSPVFASYSGTWDMSDPYRPIDPDNPAFWHRNDIALGSSAMEFIGIYSGRAPGEPGGGTLGICWREDVIKAVCLGGKIGDHPHL